jgi:hypothetical protein
MHRNSLNVSAVGYQGGRLIVVAVFRPLDYTSRWQQRLKDSYRRLLTEWVTQLRYVCLFFIPFIK